MNLASLLLPLALLLLAWPAGWLLTRRFARGPSRIARFGTQLLAGLAAVIALAHALLCLGVTAAAGGALAALSTAGVAAICWWKSRRTRPAEPTVPERSTFTPGRRFGAELLAIVSVAAMCTASAVNVAHLGVHAHDAIFIWAPKAARAIYEAPPEIDDSGLRIKGGVKTTTPANFHSEYPRGLAVLTAAAAAPFQPIDARLPRAVPLLIFVLLLLTMFDALALRGNILGGALVVLITGALPLVIYHAASGLADLPLGAMLALATVALAANRGRCEGTALALTAAIAAACLKDEGLVVALVVILLATWRLIRAGRWVGAGLSLVVPAAALAPWLALKARLVIAPWLPPPVDVEYQSHTRATLLIESVRQNAGMILVRIDQLVRELGHQILGFPVPGTRSAAVGGVVPSVLPGGNTAAQVALACGVIANIGRDRTFPLLPAGTLLLAHFGALAITPEALDWQVITAYDRLLLQATPVLIMIAVHRLTRPAPGAITTVAGASTGDPVVPATPTPIDAPAPVALADQPASADSSGSPSR